MIAQFSIPYSSYTKRTPKKFNLEARLNLGARQIFPKAELKVLGGQAQSAKGAIDK